MTVSTATRAPSSNTLAFVLDAELAVLEGVTVAAGTVVVVVAVRHLGRRAARSAAAARPPETAL
jgi:hypothetical protein